MTDATLDAARTDEPTESAPTQDPAGGISLGGRDRVSARSRVLSGLLLASGLVVALGTIDTTSSLNHIS